jgi:hypothetical protein
MSITRLHAGPRMSQAVVHGQTVYLAGVVADQAKGKSVGEQTKEILSAIDRLLAEAGSDRAKILSANIYPCRPCSRSRNGRGQARRATLCSRNRLHRRKGLRSPGAGQAQFKGKEASWRRAHQAKP